MKLNEKKLEEYLQFQPVSLVRQCLWGWLIFIIVVGALTSFFGVWKEYTRIIFPPIVLIMVVWNIWMLIKTEKKQKAYVLFIGVYCIVLSVLLLLASYKFAYTVDRFPFIFYIVISVLIYIADFILCFYYVKASLTKNVRKKSNKPSTAVKIIVIFSASGLIIAKLIMGFVSHRIQIIILIMCLAILGYIIETGSHFLYKYYLIKNREHLQ
ncbi:MAG: hypothetical protein QMB62_01850 [Oscillospiraceae bacterium]